MGTLDGQVDGWPGDRWISGWMDRWINEWGGEQEPSWAGALLRWHPEGWPISSVG